MQQTILFKAPGRSSNRPIVILTGPFLGAEYSTGRHHFADIRKMISRALSAGWQWTRCNCTPRRIVSPLFSARVSTAMAIVVVAAMWWHNISIADDIAAQKAVGYDCLLGMPWAIAWAVRASRKPMPEEGGEPCE
jgi:hypothetical protein